MKREQTERAIKEEKMVKRVKLSQKKNTQSHSEIPALCGWTHKHVSDGSDLENEWITQTQETLWWTTNTAYTHLNMLHICNCSLSQTHFKSTIKHWSPAFTQTHTHTLRSPTQTHTYMHAYVHTHASRTQSTTSMTSACLGYNHSGNSNYIIERIAVRGTLLITQCFQLLPSSSATH